MGPGAKGWDLGLTVAEFILSYSPSFRFKMPLIGRELSLTGIDETA